MTRDIRDRAAFKLRQASRLSDAAKDHWATGDELVREATRATGEARDLLAGRKPLPRPTRPVDASTCH